MEDSRVNHALENTGLHTYQRRYQEKGMPWRNTGLQTYPGRYQGRGMPLKILGQRRTMEDSRVDTYTGEYRDKDTTLQL